jgi:hypothetical protein
MKFKFNNTEFKIVKNDNNKGFLPMGMFWNIPKIKHKGIWYNCSIRFINNTLIISSLILHHENSYSVKEHLEGDYYEFKVSNFQKHLIQYLYNVHPINHRIYKFRKNIVARKKTIVVFAIAIILSAIYYLSNLYSNNAVLTWISNNLLAQTFIIFLTLSGFINIFTPFTIQKEITEKDIEEISNSKIIENQKKEEQNKKIREQATF